MSVVTYFVETSQGYLDTAAETSSGRSRQRSARFSSWEQRSW